MALIKSSKRMIRIKIIKSKANIITTVPVIIFKSNNWNDLIVILLFVLFCSFCNCD